LLVPEGWLLVVWNSIGLRVVGWVGMCIQSFYFAMSCVGLGKSIVWWIGLSWRNWTHGQLICLVTLRSYRSLLFKLCILSVFEPSSFGGLRNNVRCSSWVHWKAR